MTDNLNWVSIYEELRGNDGSDREILRDSLGDRERAEIKFAESRINDEQAEKISAPNET